MNRLWLLRCFNTGNAVASWMRGLGILICLLTIPACSLLSWSTSWLANESSPSSRKSAADVLGKIPTARTAVEVEILFVERPVGDPLLGAALWDEVDQIGSLPVDDRKGLAELGFRIGRVGANPPRALQTLMGLAAEVGNDEDKQLVGRRVVLPSGDETEITLGPPLPQATIRIPASNGGKPKQKTFENVRGVFRLKTKQLQDGWARVEFLPEIHHGRMANRPTAIRGGWRVHTSQDIDRLYRQRFSLDLNLGEIVIITGEMEPEDSLGRQFFYAADFTNKSRSRNERETDPSADEDSPASPSVQRLLIVRLADLQTAEALYPEK